MKLSSIVNFEAETFGLFVNIVPLSVTIFSFLKKKGKGFPLQSGLRAKILFFLLSFKKEKTVIIELRL
jgi:hypothetical protein